MRVYSSSVLVFTCALFVGSFREVEVAVVSFWLVWEYATAAYFGVEES